MTKSALGGQMGTVMLSTIELGPMFFSIKETYERLV